MKTRLTFVENPISDVDFLNALTAFRVGINILQKPSDVDKFKDLISQRLAEAINSAHFIYRTKGTDEIEYRAFVAGLNTTLKLLRDN